MSDGQPVAVSYRCLVVHRHDIPAGVAVSATAGWVDEQRGAVSDLAAVGVLTDAVAARLTTPDRVLVALKTRSRIHRRNFLSEVLIDIGDGTHSVLEHGYLHRVERAHGLPVGNRQLAELTPTGKVYRDVRR